MRTLLDSRSNWQVTWTKPRHIPKHTLFGYGQHHGYTNCEECGKPFFRNSGIHKRCGPWNDKESCTYKYELRKKRIAYQMRYEKKRADLLKKSDHKILMCGCGRRYIKTRINQDKCLFCLNETLTS